MKTEEKSKNLKEKISRFIKNGTKTGSRYPVGIGWSFWNDLPLTKEEGEVLMLDKSFSKFINSKGGSYFAYRALVFSTINLHPSLSIHILTADQKNPLYPYKSNIISSGLYDYNIDPDIFKDHDSSAKAEYLKICPINEVDRFLKDPSDKVRIEAYNRLGLLACAEQMAKDKSAKVRASICQALPHNHSALSLMMNDRSKWVFYSVIRKIDKSKIPLMLGSRHLKEGFIQSVLKKRMSNLGEP
jgi:hypothetical protein